MENQNFIYFLVALLAIVVQWFVIYSAVKYALTSTLKNLIPIINKTKNSNESVQLSTKSNTIKNNGVKLVQYHTKQGLIEIEPCANRKGKTVLLNGELAPDGKYQLGFMDSITVVNGVVI